MRTHLERGRIVDRGMGGFLCPPEHPEHTHSVEVDLQRPAHDRGGMSLSAAVECEWLSTEVRDTARAMLERWQEHDRINLYMPEVRDWVHQVLGYFRGCYRNPSAPAGREWHADTIIIDPQRDPLANADDHAGVHLIRNYYPEYNPEPGDFAEAYWGRKPTAASR